MKASARYVIMANNEYETQQRNLADLAAILSVLQDAGHSISDCDTERALRLLRSVRDGTAALMMKLRGGVCVYPP